MGGKTSQSQSTVTIPPEVMARYNAVNARAEDVAKQPFQKYEGQFVAGLTDAQKAGIAQTGKYAEAAQPYYQEGAAYTRAGSGDVGPLTASQIQQYQDPYTKAVADTTYQAMRQQQQQEMGGQTANAIRSGAFGGDRAGLAAANLARQQQLATGQAMSGIYSQGYQQAVQTAQGQQNVRAADLARKMQAGQQMAGLGAGAQQAGLQGAQAQIGAGTVEQQTQQADLTAKYQQFLQERGYPFQVAQFLANIAMGTGALSGSTTTTTQPSSFFSDRDLKHDVKEIGETNDGLPIYSFKYNGDNRTQIGLMAQDVEKKHPEAVGLAAGYKTVDYKKATEDSERSEKAYGGGLVPTTISMGGAVTEPGNYASGGSIVDSDDLSSILAAQRQMFAPFGGQGLYGGQGAGTPGASKPGYVPAATLPVAKLVTAQTPSQRSGQTGLGEIMSGVEKAQGFGEALLGEKGLFGEKGAGARAVQLAKKTMGKEEPKPNAPKGGQTPAPKDGSTPKTDATNTSNQKISSLEYPDRDEILRRLMDRDSVAAKNGGAIGRVGYAGLGKVIDPMELQDPSKGVNAYIEDAAEEQEDTSDDKLPGAGGGAGGGGKGKSDASTALGIAGTLANFIPGVGPAIGTGLKAASMFFNEGGVVPRQAYQQGGPGTTPGSGQPVEDPDEKLIQDFLPKNEQIESGGKNIKNPRSSAFGPHQFTEGTWKDLITKNPQLGLKPEDRLNEEAQRKAAPVHARELIKTFRAQGIDPTVETLRYGWGLGVSGGPTFFKELKENPDMPAIESSVATPKVVKSNPTWFYRPDGTPKTMAEMSQILLGAAQKTGVAGAQARAKTGDTGDVQASVQRKGVGSQAEERSALYDYLPTRKDAKGEESLDWRKILIPTLTGLGAMASSPSRYLGSAVLQGLGAGAQSFANLEQKMAETERTGAETSAIETETYMKSFKETPYGNFFFLADGSVMPAAEYTAMLRAGTAPPLLGKIPGDYNEKVQKFVAARQAARATTTPSGGAGAGTTPAGTTTTAPAGGAATKPTGGDTVKTGAVETKPLPDVTETKPIEPTRPAIPNVPPGVGFDQKSIEEAKRSQDLAISGGKLAGLAAETSEKYNKIVEANALSARDSARYIQELANNLSNAAGAKGFDSAGFAFGQRAAIVNAANTLARALNIEPMGNADSINQMSEKLKTMVAAAQAQGGSQEALGALTLLRDAVANPSMNPKVFSKLSADLMVQNQRMIDRDIHKKLFLGNSTSGDLSRAASDFERVNSAEKYNKEAEVLQKMILTRPNLIQKLSSGQVPADEINKLFKQTYGLDGMARYFLGGL